jgi:thiamine monophosphate kinase
LCFTVPPKSLDEWAGPFQDFFNIPLTRIGSVREGEGVFVEEDGQLKPLEGGAFNHLSVEEEG